jgi:hypothetical protein
MIYGKVYYKTGTTKQKQVVSFPDCMAASIQILKIRTLSGTVVGRTLTQSVTTSDDGQVAGTEPEPDEQAPVARPAQGKAGAGGPKRSHRSRRPNAFVTGPQWA